MENIEQPVVIESHDYGIASRKQRQAPSHITTGKGGTGTVGGRACSHAPSENALYLHCSFGISATNNTGLGRYPHAVRGGRRRRSAIWRNFDRVLVILPGQGKEGGLLSQRCVPRFVNNFLHVLFPGKKQGARRTQRASAQALAEAQQSLAVRQQ